MTTETQADLLQQSDELYTRYVKPLEQEHCGEYAAVSADGRVVFARTLPALLVIAEQTLPPGDFLFKVGDVDVDVWRQAI